jgi:hypothetical protein
LSEEERAALRELSGQLQREAPELWETFAQAFVTKPCWPYPWQWPALVWAWLGFAFLAAGVILAVPSAALAGAAAILFAGYRWRRSLKNGSSGSASG